MITPPRGLLPLSIALCLLASAGCAPVPSAAPAITLPPLHPEMLLDGCAELSALPPITPESPLICHRDPERPLTLWIAEPPALTYRLEGGAVTADTRRHGGRALEIQPAGDEITLLLHAPSPLGQLEGQWRVQIAPPPTPDPHVKALKALRRAGQITEAIAEAHRLLEAGDLSASSRRRVESALGRLEIAEGDSAFTGERLHRLADAYWAAGEISRAWSDLRAARFLETNQWLTPQRHDPPLIWPGALQPARHQITLAYLDGLRAHWHGQLREALALHDRALTLADRVGRADLKAPALVNLPMIYNELGLFTEGIALIDQALEDPAQSECTRQSLMANAVWLHANARWHSEARGGEAALGQQGFVHLDRLLPKLEGQPSCFRRESVASSQLDGALLCALSDRVEQAAALLAKARRNLAEVDHVAPRIDAWLAVVSAYVDWRRGDPARGLAALRDHLEGRRARLPLVSRWHIETLGGELALALGDLAEARRWLQQAEATKAQILTEIHLRQSADAFLGAYVHSTHLYTATLYALDDLDGLMDHTRRARAQLLHFIIPPQGRDPAQRAQAERYRALDREIQRLNAQRRHAPADAAATLKETQADLERQKGEILTSLTAHSARSPLDRPAPGELIVTFAPYRDHWLLLVESIDEVVAYPLTGLPRAEPLGEDLEALAQKILLPMAPQLTHATRLRVLPYGPFKRLDLHRLPHPESDQPLIAHYPIRYSLDLLPQQQGADPSAEQSALVVVNPTGNLDGAEREGRALIDRLRRAGWQVESLLREGATKEALLQRLDEVALLHYAGHGEAAADGWTNHLPLAGGGRLTTQDVLASGVSAPPLVVLSGCETGRTALRAPVETLGLGHAFLLAGAHHVVAATRPIDDAFAARFVEALYDHLDADLPLPVAFQRASLAVRTALPQSDWATFRLLSR